MPEREVKDALTGSISSSLHRLKDINNEGKYARVHNLCT